MSSQSAAGAAQPVARFYRFGDQPKIDVTPELSRRGVPGSGANVLEVTLAKGCVFPMHQHANEQFTIILSGRLRFTFPGEAAPITIGPGEVVHIPGDLPHEVEALEDTVELDVFCPARNDLVTKPA